eukprot:6222499-Lingulodinium_polyedra.AAC.1
MFVYMAPGALCAEAGEARQSASDRCWFHVVGLIGAHREVRAGHLRPRKHCAQGPPAPQPGAGRVLQGPEAACFAAGSRDLGQSESRFLMAGTIRR